MNRKVQSVDNFSQQLSAKGLCATFADSMDFVLESTGVGVWEWHLPSGQVIYSRQWSRMTGYGQEESAATNGWHAAVLPEDLPVIHKEMKRYLEKVKKGYFAVEFRVRRKDGQIIWVLDKGAAVEWSEEGEPVRLIGFIQDITRSRAAELEVQAGQAHLEHVAEIAGLAPWTWDVPEDGIRFGKEFSAMIGYRPQPISLTQEDWEALCHPQDIPAMRTAIEGCLAGRNDSFSQEVRLRHKDGHYLWTLNSGRVTAWDAGKPARLDGGQMDIAMLQRTQWKLQHTLDENQRSYQIMQKAVEE